MLRVCQLLMVMGMSVLTVVGQPRVHNSFTMFNDSMSEANLSDKRAFFKACGMTTTWLCILLEFDAQEKVVKVPSWYHRYHALGGLPATVRFLEEKLDTKVDCIKLHKNIHFTDAADEPEAYVRFCREIIDQMQEIGIQKLFISNEEPQRTRKGSPWIACFKEIIRYAHGRGIRVGFSMNNYVSTIREFDPVVLQQADFLYENFYPTLSHKDGRTTAADLPQMIQRCRRALEESLAALRARKAAHKYGLSECGIVPRITALRYPYKWDNESPFDSTGKIVDLYWRSILPAATQVGVKEIANWFMDEYPSSIYRKEMCSFLLKTTGR